MPIQSGQVCDSKVCHASQRFDTFEIKAVISYEEKKMEIGMRCFA